MRKMRFFVLLNLKIIEILLKFFERETQKKEAPNQPEFQGEGCSLFPFHRRMRFRNIKREGKEFFPNFHSFSHPYQVLLKEPFPLS